MRRSSPDGRCAFIPCLTTEVIGIRRTDSAPTSAWGVDSTKVFPKAKSDSRKNGGLGTSEVANAGIPPRETSNRLPICVTIVTAGNPAGQGQAFACARLAVGEALSVRGQLRLLTIDVADRGPLMDIGPENRTVILLRDITGAMVAYAIDEVFSIDEPEQGISGDYTVLVPMDDDDSVPVIVRALDADVPSFVGIEDAAELERAFMEYNALVMRRSLRLVE